MFSGQELSAYLRAFRKIMQLLLNEDHIGKVERDHIFMEGIPSEVQVPIQTCLMIKHPDHYPQDPYLYMQVYDAGQFVLPANAPPPTSAPNAQDTIPTLSPLAPSTCEQMPMPGTVIKCEYRHEASSFNDCAFCGSIEHFFAHCLERQRYIDAGKCKVHEEMRKLVLPNSDFIPGRGLMKDKLNRYYTNHTMQEAKASKGVTTRLFYHANSEIDAIVSYPIRSCFSSEVPDVRSDQIRSTDPYQIHHDKLLHSYPVHITLNTAYFLHLVYLPFRYISYACFRLCLLIRFTCD